MGRGKRMMDGLDQDIREHIAMETEDNIARGRRPHSSPRPRCPVGVRPSRSEGEPGGPPVIAAP
jgi:hypothetical protein